MAKSRLGRRVRSNALQLVGAILSSVLFSSLANAQMVPDGTLGTQATPFDPGACAGAGGICDITNGTTRGSNLFHSFQQFSLPNGDTASFITSAGVRNVIVRVTGIGQLFISNINGTIETLDTSFNPASRNFFLINPNGIVFGPNAQILVGGSFLASTADRMLFQDGTTFDARDQTGAPLLTVSAPTGLQMGQSPGAIRANASVLAAEQITFVGGSIELTNSILVSRGQQLQLGGLGADGTALFNGDGSLGIPTESTRADVSVIGTQLAARSGSSSKIGIYGRNLDFAGNSLIRTLLFPNIETANNRVGEITLDAIDLIQVRQGSRIANLIDEGKIGQSGNIQVTARALVMTDNAHLNVTNFGQGNAGSIFVNTRDRVLLDSGARFISEARQNGNSGTIRVATGQFTAINGATIANGIYRQGQGGEIVIDARDRILVGEGVRIFSVLREDATGVGGNLRFNTENISLANGASVFTYSLGAGNAGDIQVNAGSVSLTNSASLESSTFDRGNSGNIEINARDRVSLEQSNIGTLSGSTGNGGNIQINTRSLLIDGGQVPINSNGSLAVGSRLSTETSGTGNSGNIIINAQDQILLDRGGAITSQMYGAGDAGDIRINTGSLIGTNISVIQSVTAGQGNAGNVTVNARDFILFNGGIEDGFGSGIASQVLQNASGEGGDIDITAGSLILQDNARLSVTTFGNSNAGSVQINVRDQVRLEGSSSIFSTVDKDAIGKGGNIDINAGSLTLLSGSQLDASTFGRGNSGDIVVNVRDTVVVDGINPTFPDRSSTLFSEVFTGAEGNGGNIYVSTGSLSVTNGGQLDAKTRGRGNAGSIFITARDSILFDGSTPEGKSTRALSSVESGAAGNSGNIEIMTGTLIVSNGAQLLANTQGQGNGGSIRINARESVIFSGKRIVGTQTYPSAVFTRVNRNGVGDAGNAEITAGSLTISDEAGLFSETLGRGNAGDITINTRDFVVVKDRGEISARTSSAFEGGNISVTTGNFQVNNGTVTVNSQGTGVTGSITVNSQFVQLSDRARIIAEAASQNGGDITFNILDLLVLRRGSTISTTAGTAEAGGNGGNITITVPKGFIVGVKSENSDITANAFTGSGGRVSITAQGIFGLQFRPNLTPFSDITASSTFGASGVVTLNTPNVDPNRGLTQLPQNLVETNRILANSCIVRDRAPGGTFVITGTGGLPVRPGDPPLPAFSTGDVRGLEKAEGGRQKAAENASIVEAQGIYELPSGQVILSWECPR